MNEMAEQSKSITWTGGGNAGINLGSTAPTVKEAPVMREYGNLNHELQRLAETVDGLRVKLEPVLGVHLEAADGNKSEPQPAISPLGESLRSDVARVRNIHREVQLLIDRIEV